MLCNQRFEPQLSRDIDRHSLALHLPHVVLRDELLVQPACSSSNRHLSDQEPFGPTAHKYLNVVIAGRDHLGRLLLGLHPNQAQAI